MRNENTKGTLWMIASMAAFAIEDLFVKAAALDLAVGQILIMFGMGGAICFAGVTLYSGNKLWHNDVLSRPMRYRFLYEITGRLFYVLAIALIPLSLATAILQATPILVVAGAAVFFKERVSFFRWCCVFIGLIGVVIILRPGAEGFSLLTLLAVIGMLGFAARDLASRAAPKTLSTSLLGFYGFLSIVVAGVAVSIWNASAFKMPDTSSWLYVGGAIFAGVLAYFALMKAMRTGEVSVVTPFRYTRLLFGVILGVAFFQESLPVSTLVGASLIVGSGLLAGMPTNQSLLEKFKT